MSANSRSIASLALLMCMLLWPSGLAVAQDEPATGDIVASESVSGTVQFTVDGQQVINALLAEGPKIPGGFGRYGPAFFWTIIFGGLGGLVYEFLRLHGNLELPHRYQPDENPEDEQYSLAQYATASNVYDFGVLARIFVGSMAAIAILLVISPEDRVKLFSVAVIAGSAGASIFDTLRARLVATLAAADAADLRVKSEQLDEKLKEMDELLKQLKQGAESHLERGGITEESAIIPSDAPAGAVVERSILDQLSEKLNEAKGIQSTMERRRVVP